MCYLWSQPARGVILSAMAHQLATEALDAVASGQEAWTRLHELMLGSIKGPNGETVDQESVLPGTRFSLNDLDRRMASTFAVSASLKKIQNIDAIPIAHFVNLINGMVNLETQINEISTEIGNIPQNGGIQSYNVETTELVSANNSLRINFSHKLNNVGSGLDDCLVQLYSILNISGAKKIDLFQNSSQEITKTLNNALSVQKKLDELSNVATLLHKHLSELEQRSQKSTEEIESLKEEARTSKTHVDESNRQGSDALTVIQNVLNDAQKLKASADTYQADFDKLKEQLDKHERFRIAQTNSVNELVRKLEEDKKHVAQLIDESNKLLVGATNVALGSNYKNTLDKMSEAVSNAKDDFHRSIIWLLFSSLPLVLYVIAGTTTILDELFAGRLSGESVGMGIGKIVALMVLTLPFIWRTKFAAQNFSNLFRLKEHYEHKYSLAMSVKGFKEQAPKYEEEFAALTFEHLSFNPADKISESSEVSEHPSPLVEKLMEVLRLKETKGGDG